MKLSFARFEYNVPIIDKNFGQINKITYKDKEYYIGRFWQKEDEKRGMTVKFSLNNETNEIDNIIVSIESFTPREKKARNLSLKKIRQIEEYKHFAMHDFSLHVDNQRFHSTISDLPNKLREIKNSLPQLFKIDDFIIKYRIINTSFEAMEFDEFINTIKKLAETDIIYSNNLIIRNNLTSKNYFYCPLCNNWILGSEYLFKTFADDDKANWLANMVTHYRHGHITSWNKCWGYGGNYYRHGWFGNYDEEKQKVNERAKRQIIRKATKFLIDNEIKSDTFLKLQNTTEETLKLAKNKLN